MILPLKTARALAAEDALVELVARPVRHRVVDLGVVVDKLSPSARKGRSSVHSAPSPASVGEMSLRAMRPPSVIACDEKARPRRAGTGSWPTWKAVALSRWHPVCSTHRAVADNASVTALVNPACWRHRGVALDEATPRTVRGRDDERAARSARRRVTVDRRRGGSVRRGPCSSAIATSTPSSKQRRVQRGERPRRDVRTAAEVRRRLAGFRAMASASGTTVTPADGAPGVDRRGAIAPVDERTSRRGRPRPRNSTPRSGRRPRAAPGRTACRQWAPRSCSRHSSSFVVGNPSSPKRGGGRAPRRSAHVGSKPARRLRRGRRVAR